MYPSAGYFYSFGILDIFSCLNRISGFGLFEAFIGYFFQDYANHFAQGYTGYLLSGFGYIKAYIGYFFHDYTKYFVQGYTGYLLSGFGYIKAYIGYFL